MTLTDYKTVMILFEPRQGGNHFANILSTSPKIQDRAQSPNYRQYLLDSYKSSMHNAHFGELLNVEVNNVDKLITFIKNSTKPVVICGHLAETYYLLDQIKQQGSLGIINFENYNLNEIVLSRMFNNLEPQNREVPVGLLQWSHRGEVVEKTFNVNSADMYNIETNWLFNEDIVEFLKKVNIDLDLDLDLNFCLELHKLWFKKVKI